jgi:hypothetical protein
LLIVGPAERRHADLASAGDDAMRNGRSSTALQKFEAALAHCWKPGTYSKLEIARVKMWMDAGMQWEWKQEWIAPGNCYEKALQYRAGDPEAESRLAWCRGHQAMIEASRADQQGNRELAAQKYAEAAAESARYALARERLERPRTRSLIEVLKQRIRSGRREHRCELCPR